jgi:hypothetical protein
MNNTTTHRKANRALAEKGARNMESMTKNEREDLQRLIRQREKVLKSAAQQRSSELLADFENQMGSEYAFDDDAVWAQAMKDAEGEVAKAKVKVEARCRQLGIPKQFAPGIELDWRHRGYGNAVAERRSELRRMAQTRIDAIEQKAITEIQLSCLKAQEQIAVAGLSSAAAKQLFSQLPAIEKLMPTLSFAEVAGESEPPVAEQLVSPNALRQRRFREKQRALRNGEASVTVAVEGKE